MTGANAQICQDICIFLNSYEKFKPFLYFREIPWALIPYGWGEKNKIDEYYSFSHIDFTMLDWIGTMIRVSSVRK